MLTPWIGVRRRDMAIVPPMILRTLVVPGLLLATACGPKETPESTPPVTADAPPAEPAEEPAADGVLVLDDAKLFELDDPANAFIIAGNGNLMLGGETVATLSEEGTITLPDGTVVLEVTGDDAVVVNGEASGLSLTDDGGTIAMGEDTVVVAFQAGGVVAIDPPPDNAGLAMGHEGCDGEMAKTCMVVMFALLTPQAPPPGTPEVVDLPASEPE